MNRWSNCGLLFWSIALFFAHGSVAQDDVALTRLANAEQISFFETEIRPVLAEHCYGCHGSEKQKGGLRLDSLPAILEGGESGPAIVLGDPLSSLLVQAIRYESLQMPPTGKISASKIDALVRWITAKAPAPDDFLKGVMEGNGESSTEHLSKHRSTDEITEADRIHWSFVPIKRRLPSKSLDGMHPIDVWILEALERESLVPTPRANARELIRRVSYTLTGLPPTFEEMERWVERLVGRGADGGKDDGVEIDGGEIDQRAYREFVDHLLESPAYGEHWGRHWLDIVRFAQSNGYERDGYKPHAWRYRDYVVKAFREDKPYDRFVLEQLAGDELSDANSDSRIATGFYRVGVWDDEPDDKRQAEYDDLDDVMVTIGSAFLGLSIGCARCHDHKFDPIPQADYYRMLACVRGVQRYSNPENNIENGTSFPLADNEIIRERMKGYLEAKQTEANGGDRSLGLSEWGLVVREFSVEPPSTHVLVRGNAATPGAGVTPGFLRVLAPGSRAGSVHVELRGANVESPSVEFQGVENFFTGSESPLRDLFPSSGRRLGLARWLVSSGNPLTARVLVNRLWHYHFGRGIVATTADFGVAGATPTHPELLDHLAMELIEHGWSIKHMHRHILSSETFQRTSKLHADHAIAQRAMTQDPSNRLLWKQNVRRLEAESIRDSILLASGELNGAVGGVEMYPKLSGEVLAGQSKPGLDWRVSSDEQQNRKSLYAVVKRSVRDPLLETFDYSNTTSPLTERPVTTVATQALMLLNSRFTAERSQRLARRVIALTDNSLEQVDQLYRLMLQRNATEKESQASLALLERMATAFESISEELHFRVDVPVSLFSGYRQQLSGRDFFLTPSNLFGESPWQSYSGIWGGGYEGIDVVDKRFGPFALLTHEDFRDGVVRGRMKLDRTTEVATLFLRGRQVAVPNQGVRWEGVALRFDLVKGTVAIEEHGTRIKEGVVTPVDSAKETGIEGLKARLRYEIPVERWFPFRFEVRGERARVWLDALKDESPLLEVVLDASVMTSGTLGVASWGGSISLDGAELEAHSLQRDERQASGEHTTGAEGLKGASQRTEAIALARARGGRSVFGPPKSWTSYGGQWTLRRDGVVEVMAEQGPKLLWDEVAVKDGEVSVEVKMLPGAANIGGLIFCVSDPKVGADNWYGYELSLDLPNKSLLFGEHRNNWTPMARVSAGIEAGRWHRLRSRIESQPQGGTKLTVWLDDISDPVLEQFLPQPLPGGGVGLRTWGSAMEFRDFSIRADGKEVRSDWTEQGESFGDQGGGLGEVEVVKDWSRKKALEMLGRTLMNLNEFLYVD